jgi:sucrose-6-phosphate hydrolase SacC (GH32 family)
MALYLDGDRYALFSSPDLKEWKKLCDVPPFGDAECPDLFPLAVEGDPRTERWIFWGAGGNYSIGRFEGTSFVKESGPHRFEFGKNSYAAQTYSGIPPADGRRIQIAWMRGGEYPGMPFNQQMTFPCELALRKYPAGLRLCCSPVKEIEKLHGKKNAWSGVLREGENPLSSVSGELFDLRAKIAPGSAKEVVLAVRGTPIQFDFVKRELQCLGKTASIELVEDVLPVQILVDRSSIEIFVNRGKTTMSFCFLPPLEDKSLSLTAHGGEAEIKELAVWELNSIWEQPVRPERSSEK